LGAAKCPPDATVTFALVLALLFLETGDAAPFTVLWGLGVDPNGIPDQPDVCQLALNLLGMAVETPMVLSWWRSARALNFFNLKSGNSCGL